MNRNFNSHISSKISATWQGTYKGSESNASDFHRTYNEIPWKRTVFICLQMLPSLVTSPTPNVKCTNEQPERNTFPKSPSL